MINHKFYCLYQMTRAVLRGWTFELCNIGPSLDRYRLILGSIAKLSHAAEFNLLWNWVETASDDLKQSSRRQPRWKNFLSIHQISVSTNWQHIFPRQRAIAFIFVFVLRATRHVQTTHLAEKDYFSRISPAFHPRVTLIVCIGRGRW